MFHSRLFAAFGLIVVLCLPMPGYARTEADLWSGAIAEMQQGRPEAALPALERLVSDYPQNASYRLELAYALFQTGRLGRARYHVDLALLGRLTDSERMAALSIRRDIDAQRFWTGYFQFNIQPETNPGRQTTVTSTTIAGLDFTLNDDARAKASTSYIASGGLTYTGRITDTFRIVATGSVWSRWNEDERLRDDVLSFRAGPRWVRPDGSRFEFGASASRRWNADRPESDGRGLYIGGAIALGQRSLLEIFASREQIAKRNGLPDETDTALRLGFAGAVSDTVVLRADIGTQQRDSSNALVSWEEWSLGIGAQAFLRGGWQVQGNLTAARRDWGGVQPLFGVSRLDERVRLDLGVLDRDFRIGPFVPELRMGVEYGTSNIDIYEYENRYMTVSFTRQF